MRKVVPTDRDFPELRKQAENKIIAKEKKQLRKNQSGLDRELRVNHVDLEMHNEHQSLTSDKEYSDLFNQAPVGYFIMDRHGVIINANDTGSKQLMLDKNKIIGEPFSVFLSSESHQDNYSLHSNLVIKTEELQHFECEIKRKDKSVFSALVESSLMKDENNEFKCLLSTVTDISERKLQEHKFAIALLKEKELSEMKSQLISMLSHEFRTPMAAILSSADLMDRYNDPEDVKKKAKHFQRIKSSITRLKDILSGFLSLNHLEKGVIKNNPELFNLVGFLVELSDEIKSSNTTHQIVYEHSGEIQKVRLDKKLLKICLTHIIGNAIKYSSNGTLIEITSEKNSDSKLKITIKDVGFGIPESDQPRIFEQFFRAKNAQTIQGVGLGLSITKDIISLMKGEISFDSRENKGTEFVLSFPANNK